MKQVFKRDVFPDGTRSAEYRREKRLAQVRGGAVRDIREGRDRQAVRCLQRPRTSVLPILPYDRDARARWSSSLSGQRDGWNSSGRRVLPLHIAKGNGAAKAETFNLYAYHRHPALCVLPGFLSCFPRSSQDRGIGVRRPFQYVSIAELGGELKLVGIWMF